MPETTLHLETDPRRLAVTRAQAAKALGCSVQHIDDLVTRGSLKKIYIGDYRAAITWSSLIKFVENAEKDTHPRRRPRKSEVE
jgi:hypothetical protein